MLLIDQVLDFSKGRLQTLLWKSYGCSNCKGNSSSDSCINGQDCAIPLASCKKNGGKVDCSISFQLSFSGSDKYHKVFNSWYEIGNLRQYSLYGLYSNLKNSLTSEYNKYFWKERQKSSALTNSFDLFSMYFKVPLDECALGFYHF